MFQSKCYKIKEECISYSDTLGCTSCKTGYSLVKYTCIKDPEKCLIIENHVGCLACKEGYYLNNFNCV